MARRRFKRLLAARAAIKAAVAIPPRSLTALSAAIEGATKVKLRALEVRVAQATLDRWRLEDEVKAALESAWTVHRLAPLKAALARATEIKLNEAEPSLIKCRAWKLEIDEAQRQLKSALDTRNLSALTAALDLTEPLGLKEEPETVEARRWQLRLQQLLAALEQAVAARDLKALSDAIASCAEARFAPDPLLSTAKALHAKLEAERLARDALTRAITAKSIDQLTSALAQAAGAGVTASSDDATGGALVRQATELKDRLLLEARLAADVAAAIKANEVQALEAAIGECRANKFTCADLPTAQKQLSTLVGEAVRKQLRAALATRSLPALAAGLERATQVGLSAASEPVLVEATTLFNQLTAEQKAMTELSAALSSASATNCEPLERALSHAEGVMSDKQLPALVAARSTLKRLQLKHALLTAANSHDLPRLQQLLSSVSGLDSNDPDLVNAQQWRAKLQALEQQLQDATTARDLSKLTAALALVEEYKFETSTKREAALRVSGQLTRQREAVALLESAMKSGDVNLLDAALNKAKACAAECTLAPETEKAVQAAAAARQLVLDQTKLHAELSRALESKDVAGCERLLAKAATLKLEEASEVTNTRSWLSEVAALRKRLANASEQRDVSALDEAAAAAAVPAYGAALEAEVTAARQLSGAVKAAKSELSSALESRSISALSPAIEGAAKIGFGPTDTALPEARRVLTRWKELESTLEKAVEAADLNLLTAALAAVDEQKYSSERVVTARALRNKLGGERQARAALAAVMSTSDIEVVRQALSRARELGLAAADASMVAAEKHLSKLVEDAKLRAALAQATAARDLPRLDSLLAAPNGLDANDNDLVNAQQWRAKLQALEQQLQDATTARDLSKLTAALAVVEEYKFETSTKREAALQVSGQLTRQREAVALLESAMKSGDVSRLEAALDKARECAAECTLAPETEKAVQAASAARQLVLDQTKVRGELARSLEGKDVTTCERLLAKAATLKLEEASEVTATRSWLHEVAALRKRLANASDQRDVTALDEAVVAAAAPAMGAALEAEVSARRQLSIAVKAAKAELTHALESRVVSVLASAIDAASAVGFGAADVSLPEARRTLSRWRQFEASLEKAIESGDLALLTAAVAAVDEQKYTSERVVTARALRNKLGGEREARAALAAAISSPDPEVVRQALTRARELGLSSTDSSMVGAERHLNRLLDDAKLRVALTRCTANRELSRLEQLLAAVGKSGLDANEPEVVSAQQWRAKLHTLEQQLHEATAARDLSKLAAALALVEEYKFESSAKREAAQRVSGQLTRQREAVALLESAVASGDVSKLDAALSKAKECAAESPLALETEKAVQAAAAARQLVLDQTKLRAELTRALESKDVAACERLLAKAASVKLEDSAEVSATRSWLSEVAALRKRLATATEQRDVNALDEAVAAAAAPAYGAALEAEVSAARQLATKLKAAKADLSNALETRSITALSAAIESAAKVGLGATDASLSDARRTLSRWREIESSLERSIEAVDVAQITTILAAADEYKYSSERVSAARTLRNKLGGERDARAALSAALKASEPDAVRQALTRARELNLSATDPAMIACEKHLSKLIEQEKLRAGLNKAVADRDATACASSLDRAVAADLTDAEPAVQAARAWLKQAAEARKRLSAVATASNKEVDVLSAAISACTSIGLEFDRAVSEAQSLLKALKDVKAKCAAAVEQRSLPALDTAIDRAAKAGLSAEDSDVAEAKKCK